jgi:hypothetical protein
MAPSLEFQFDNSNAAALPMPQAEPKAHKIPHLEKMAVVSLLMMSIPEHF